MGGQRHAEEGLYVTPLTFYREVESSDASPEAIQEVIDLSASRFGLVTMNLYFQGTVGDVFAVYVSNNAGDVWYEKQRITLGRANQVVSVSELPARQIKVAAVTIASAAVIHEEHVD